MKKILAKRSWAFHFSHVESFASCSFASASAARRSSDLCAPSHPGPRQAPAIDPRCSWGAAYELSVTWPHAPDWEETAARPINDQIDDHDRGSPGEPRSRLSRRGGCGVVVSTHFPSDLRQSERKKESSGTGFCSMVYITERSALPRSTCNTIRVPCECTMAM